MLSLGVVHRLHDQREAFVQLGDLRERRGVGGVVARNGERAGEQGVLGRDADIVDGRQGVSVVIGVDTDGVGELERGEGGDVREDEVGELGEGNGVGVEDLGTSVSNTIQNTYTIGLPYSA